MVNNEYVIGFFLDLRKAFDTATMKSFYKTFINMYLRVVQIIASTLSSKYCINAGYFNTNFQRTFPPTDVLKQCVYILTILFYNRRQFVSYNSCSSEKSLISCIVPQGSNSGPLLF